MEEIACTRVSRPGYLARENQSARSTLPKEVILDPLHYYKGFKAGEVDLVLSCTYTSSKMSRVELGGRQGVRCIAEA